MRLMRMKYIKGAPKYYPLWNKVTIELQERILTYHEELKKEGYSIKAINIAEKEGRLYWILANENTCYLEQYAVEFEV